VAAETGRDQGGTRGARQDGNAGRAAELVERVDQRGPQARLGRIGVGERGGKGRVQSLIEQGQRAGTFRRDLPRHWLVTTAYTLMHAAAEDVTAGRLDADDAARLITATLLAALTPRPAR
jgi:hypothetical protein